MTEEIESLNDPRWAKLYERSDQMMPKLVRMKYRLRLADITPIAVLMPAEFDVKYVGEGSGDGRSTIMGIPVEFSREDKWGLIIGVDDA